MLSSLIVEILGYKLQGAEWQRGDKPEMLWTSVRYVLLARLSLAISAWITYGLTCTSYELVFLDIFCSLMGMIWNSDSTHAILKGWIKKHNPIHQGTTRLFLSHLLGTENMAVAEFHTVPISWIELKKTVMKSFLLPTLPIKDSQSPLLFHPFKTFQLNPLFTIKIFPPCFTFPRDIYINLDVAQTLLNIMF